MTDLDEPIDAERDDARPEWKTRRPVVTLALALMFTIGTTTWMLQQMLGTESSATYEGVGSFFTYGKNLCALALLVVGVAAARILHVTPGPHASVAAGSAEDNAAAAPPEGASADDHRSEWSTRRPIVTLTLVLLFTIGLMVWLVEQMFGEGSNDDYAGVGSFARADWFVVQLLVICAVAARFLPIKTKPASPKVRCATLARAPVMAKAAATTE